MGEAELFGTDEPAPHPRLLRAGPLSAEIAGGAVGAVRWNGREVLRGLAHPVRDPDWGTWPEETLSETVEEDGAASRYARRFRTAGGAVEGRFDLHLQAEGRLEARVAFRALAPLRTNRASLVVLHPVAAEAGRPLAVRHPDGTSEETTFPRLIRPDQPARDIAGLRWTLDGLTLDLAFRGEVFEMEDQRNWSDASFKTYGRPLALPHPFDIPADGTWEQSVLLVVEDRGSGRAGRGADDRLVLGEAAGRMPTVALATEPGWEDRSVLPDLPRLLRLDLRAGDWTGPLAEAMAAHPAPELELILPDEAPAAARVLAALGPALGGARPASATALPAAWLASHQPGGPFPPGLGPAEAAALLRAALPGVSVGAGVLTNFTELNRLPRLDPEAAFVTYATTAIVHAADDASVMQTLEALPMIHASAARLAGGRPLRLGLCAIPMRTNPYGSRLVPNPARGRVAMAGEDPRHAAPFGAAFAVGVLAATEGHPVERLALAAPRGPLGLLGPDGRPSPLAAVVRRLGTLAGRARRRVEVPDGIAAMATEGPEGLRVLLANLTARERRIALPAPLRAGPPGDGAMERTDRVRLGPFAAAWVET